MEQRGRKSPPCSKGAENLLFFYGLVCLGFLPELFCQMLSDEVISFVMREKFSH